MDRASGLRCRRYALQHLPEQSRFAFGEVLVHPEVPGLEAVAVEPGRGPGDGEAFLVEQRVVAGACDRCEQSERLEFGHLRVVEPGGADQLPAGEADPA